MWGWDHNCMGALCIQSCLWQFCEVTPGFPQKIFLFTYFRVKRILQANGLVVHCVPRWGGQSTSAAVLRWRCEEASVLSKQCPILCLNSTSDESLINPLRSLDSPARSMPSISVCCIPFGLYFSGDNEYLQGSLSLPLVFAAEREEGQDTCLICRIWNPKFQAEETISKLVHFIEVTNR